MMLASLTGFLTIFQPLAHPLQFSLPEAHAARTAGGSDGIGGFNPMTMHRTEEKVT